MWAVGQREVDGGRGSAGGDQRGENSARAHSQLSP